MKLVSDVVQGVRTIKCYGWEDHFVNKINAHRGEQLCNIANVNLISCTGLAIFQNVGLIAVSLIFVSQWYDK